MENISMNAHAVKEVRILRGTDDLSHLLRIMIVGKDDTITDISLFGGNESRFPILIDEECDNILTNCKINFIGDIQIDDYCPLVVNEEEE